MDSGLYEGMTWHERLRPVRHRFRFRLALLWLDLEELEALQHGPTDCGGSRALQQVADRFQRTAHWGSVDTPLSVAVRQFLEEQGGAPFEGPIRLLTQLPSAGFVFNPISLYFCFDSTQHLQHIVAEVRNIPWLGRQLYLLQPEQWDSSDTRRPTTRKTFHVSPFMGMDHSYRWRVQTSETELFVQIEVLDELQPIFTAGLQLRRRPLTPWSLRRVNWWYLLQPQRVVLLIYWHALRLWWKGAPYHPHPDVPSQNPQPTISTDIHPQEPR